MLIIEIWKDIPGYEGKYQASSLGRIKSMNRKVRGVNPYTGVEFMRSVPERILKPGMYCKTGHVSVVLSGHSNGKPVHQLVALAFYGPCPTGYEVLHKNGNPRDNSVSNLHYGTRTENILDVYKFRAWRKLDLASVDEIRKQLRLGLSQSLIAKNFNVSVSTINKIKLGRTFSWYK